MQNSNWGMRVFTSAKVVGKPFEAQWEQVVTEKTLGGQVSRQVAEGTIHRDAAGRTRKESRVQIAPETDMHLIYISDPDKEVLHVLDVKSKTVTSLFSSSEGINNDSPDDLLQSGLPGRDNAPEQQIVEGFVCSICQISSEQAESKIWYSAELSEVLLEKSSGDQEETTLRIFNIRRVEPDLALFTVPSDYRDTEKPQADVPSSSASMNSNMERDGTDLTYAAATGDVAAVKNLLMGEADVDAKNSIGETALIWAARSGHVSVVEALLVANADVNVRSDRMGATALMYAAESGHTNVTQALLSAGADVNIKDIADQTALMRAAWAGNTSVVEMLLTEGANVNATQQQGMTALMWAVIYNHPETARILLARGAEVNAKNIEGQTALSFAKQRGQSAVIQLLQLFGATE